MGTSSRRLGRFGRRLGPSALVLAVAACARIAGLDQSQAGAARVGEDGGAIVTAEGAQIVPARLTIHAACKTAGTSDDPIIVRNGSGAPMDYQVDVDDPQSLALQLEDGTSVATTKGTLAARASSPPVRVVATSSTVGTSTKSVTVTAGGHPHVLPVDLTVAGSSIRLSAPLVDFGPVHDGNDGAQTLTVANDGTDPVTIAGWSPAVDTSVLQIGSGSVTIDAHGTAPVTLTYHAMGSTTLDTVVTPTTTAPLCADAPTLHVMGHAVNTSVTVNPGSLDFGPVRCNTSAALTKKLTITNYATSPASVMLDPSTFFALSPAGPIAVPAGQAVDVSVTLAAKSTPGAHAETLTAHIAGPTTMDQPITLATTITGLLLSVDATALSFAKKDDARSCTLTAITSDAAFVSVAVIGDYTAGFGPQILGFFPSAIRTDPPTSAHTVGVAATKTNPNDATLSFTSFSPLCAPAPTVRLDGN